MCNEIDEPQLGERLAADYVLGTMPRRARRRFERAMARDATLAARGAAWSDRLTPLDEMTADAPPPARVWRAIERRVGHAAPASYPHPRAGTLGLWRGVAAAAIAACAALVLYIALYSPPLPKIVAVLADRTGLPGWIAFAGPHSHRIGVSAIGAVGGDRQHSFDFWGIAGGAPRPLGVLPADPERPLWVGAGVLPAAGGALAVSIEPAGGSPTGQPTGPVIYQGKVLQPPP